MQKFCTVATVQQFFKTNVVNMTSQAFPNNYNRVNAEQLHDIIWAK